MKKIFRPHLFFAIFFAWVAVSLATAQPEWKVFTSLKGNFSILMPSTPNEETQTITTDAGAPAEQLNFVVTLNSNVYFVTYFEYPFVVDVTPAGMDKIQNACLKSIKAKLISESSTTLSGYPGRIIHAETEDGKLAADLRLLGVNKRLYLVLIMSNKPYSLTAMDSQYFSSFKLLRP